MSGVTDVPVNALWLVPDDVAPTHCPADEYRQYIASLDVTREMKSRYLSIHRVFVEAYPDLGEWFAQPLEVRVGRIFGMSAFHPEHPISFDARRYLYFLALTDRIRLDYAFLFSLSPMYSKSLARSLGFDLVLGEVTRRYAAMGYCVNFPNASLVWTMSRVAMRVVSGNWLRFSNGVLRAW